MLELLLILAVLIERVVELLTTPLFKIWEGLTKYKPLLPYLAMAIGITITVYYELDLVWLAAISVGFEIPTSVVGQVLTGILFGGGASIFHQIISKFAPPNSGGL